MIEKNEGTGPNQLNALRLIFPDNLLVPIIECRIFCKPLEELKASRVECGFKVFFTSQVLDDNSVISANIVPIPFACEWVGVDALVSMLFRR